jgi:flagellar hook-associated protein 2
VESPGSSILSALGGGSGVDFTGLARDLSEASYGLRRKQVEQRRDLLEAKVSASARLRGSLLELSSALGSRLRGGDLAPRATTSSAVATVTVEPGSDPRGSYTLEVGQLARGQVLASRSFTEPEAVPGEGTLRIRLGVVEGEVFTANDAAPAIEIEVPPEATLDTIAKAITAQGGGAVSAYVAQGSGGAQLVMKGRDGEANGFVVEVDADPLAGATSLSDLAWHPAGGSGRLHQDARDALFALDGVEMRNSENRVTGLPEGMVLQLNAAGPDARTNVRFSRDEGAVREVMADLVAALNEIATTLGEDAAAKGGVLATDPGARELKRDLARLGTEVVMPNAADGEPRTLADLGLSLNRDGTFRLDTARLDSALAENGAGVAAMFTTGLFGVFATIDRLVRSNTAGSDTGTLGGSVARYENRIERSDEKLAAIADAQERLRMRLTRELVAAEQRIAGSQSTLSFLQSQIAIWNERD